MRKDRLYILPVMAALCMLLYSCATIGNPEGGARDEDPPRFVSSNPIPGATNVERRRIELSFNELVNVRDAFKNVVISPVSKQMPRVSTSGRRVIVNFQDSLLPNTTYTIDFGNAIEDYNEGNKLQGFAYSFSTGSEIDSLRISGMVLDALTLEPQQGMLVGVHTNAVDTTFRKTPLLRVARTDDYGRFVMRNLAPGEYSLYALGDLNNDYMWDNPEEPIAFYPTLLSPYTEATVATDTLYNMKTGVVDTIVQRGRTRFLPNDILLSTFKADFKPRYLVNHERMDSARIQLTFSFKSDSLPRIWLPDFPNDNDWHVMSHSATNDTIDLWLKPDFVRMDTLRLATQYYRTAFDKPNELTTDTLQMLKPKPKASRAKKVSKNPKDTVQQPQITFLEMSIQSGAQHVYNPVRITMGEPLDSINPQAFHLQQKVDTLWVDLPPVTLLRDSLNPTKYNIPYAWEYGGEYRLTVDSIAAIGMYGHHNKPVTANLRVKAEEDYGNLLLNITGAPDSIPILVQLLNSNDAQVRIQPVADGSVYFSNLDPATYYARLILDTNDNGRWDAGDYLTMTQPEDVYYYPGKLNVKKNWDVEQSWNINSTPIDKQKPDAIKKNKPPTPKNQKKKPQAEDDDEDDPFDVNRNPFDPNSGRSRSTNSGNRNTRLPGGISRPSMTR